MSEPRAQAEAVDVVVPGVRHWSVHDDRIEWRSDAYAITGPAGTVLIDPLPLADAAFAPLGPVAAVCLTIQSHQRSAWRYRRAFGVPVYAPRGAAGLEEKPDVWYDDGSKLPGGLRAIHAPGPCDASYAFLLSGTNGGVLFVGDLLTGTSSHKLGFVPDEYQDAPGQTRESVRALLSEPFESVCSGHAAPIAHSGRAAIEQALANDTA